MFERVESCEILSGGSSGRCEGPVGVGRLVEPGESPGVKYGLTRIVKSNPENLNT